MKKNNQIELTDKGIDLLSQSYSDTNFFLLPDVGLEIAEIEHQGLTDEEKNRKEECLIK